MNRSLYQRPVAARLAVLFFAVASLDSAGAATTGDSATEDWKARVQRYSRGLDASSPKATAAALDSTDPAEVFAALSLEFKGSLRFPIETLTSTLKKAASEKVATAVLALLSQRKEGQALRAIASHLYDRGIADYSAAKILAKKRHPAAKAVFVSRASQADGDNSADLTSIKALAPYPGDDVIVLLRRLEKDWSVPVQMAAKEALAARAKLGLKTKVPLKAVPTGRTVSELAYSGPSRREQTQILDKKTAEVAEAVGLDLDGKTLDAGDHNALQAELEKLEQAESELGDLPFALQEHRARIHHLQRLFEPGAVQTERHTPVR